MLPSVKSSLYIGKNCFLFSTNPFNIGGFGGVKKLFVNTNGDFFPCEKANECSRALLLGNVNDGINIDAVKKIYNIGEMNAEICKDCWAIKLCSCCAVNIDDGVQISSHLQNKHCESQKEALREELLQYALAELIRKEFSKNET